MENEDEIFSSTDSDNEDKHFLKINQNDLENYERMFI
jgi:hypothetical protein